MKGFLYFTDPNNCVYAIEANKRKIRGKDKYFVHFIRRSYAHSVVYVDTTTIAPIELRSYKRISQERAFELEPDLLQMLKCCYYYE